MFSKVTKKVVAIALVFSLALAASAVAPADNSASAASKLKINKKSASLNVKKTLTLTTNKSATWTTSNKELASISKKSGKKTVVDALSPGKVTITAKSGSSKVTCKITVKPAKSGTEIYNLAKEMTAEYTAPVKCPYSKFSMDSFKIWLCRATFYDPANGGHDYRGVKMKCSLTFKNSGARDLPELGFAFNYTKGTSDAAYPFALHIKPKMESKLKKDKAHKRCTIVEKKIKKGKTYTYNFTFTIPKGAINGDKDSATGKNYPIMFYLANMKDSSPYKKGDEVTILKCKWTVA